jgi:hypothetical protein
MSKACQHEHMFRCSISVSRNFIEHGTVPWRKVVDAHAEGLLLESVKEKFGLRYFVAHLREERPEKDSRMDVIVYHQWWVVTLH